ncbi:MAG: serine hydrolase domain-containing protein, partial [Pirellulaceae bacterium]
MYNDRASVVGSLCLLCALLRPLPLLADAPPAVQVDELFVQFDRPSMPGCAVGIIREGKLLYSRGFGAANLDFEVPNSPETIFEIGSFAKSFTCACVAILLDRGKITQDADIRCYLPEMHAFAPPVRIQDLIRCESGVWDQWHVAQLAGWQAQPVEAPYGKSDMLTLLSGQRTLPFEPGSQFRYGTGDYFLLSMIVERVTGQTFADFARDQLFRPLGMRRTFQMENPAQIVPQRATGYDHRSRGTWVPWLQGSAAPGGRGLYTCVEDLYRWDQGLQQRQLPSGKYMQEFLERGTLLENRRVLDARPSGTYRGLKRIQFTGGMPGYVAAMTRFPDQRFTVICLCNNSQIAPWEINARIADIYLNKELGPPEPSTDHDAAGREQDHKVRLDDRDLRDKVGAFRLRGEDRIWKIEWSEGQLTLVDHLNEPHPLIPMGRNRFRPLGGFFHESARLVFERTSATAPYSLTSRWVGGTLEFDRVNLAEPSEQSLRDYVGEYYSDELATTYRCRVEKGKLWLRVNNRGWEPLDATVCDEFVPGDRENHDNRILRFLRDPQGQVTGMSASLWRV